MQNYYSLNQTITILIQVNMIDNHTLKLGPTISTPDDAVVAVVEEFDPRAFVIPNECVATSELPEYKMR